MLKLDDWFQYAEGVKPISEEDDNVRREVPELAEGVEPLEEDDAPEVESDRKLDVNELTVAEVHEAVKNGDLSAEEAYEAESRGKKRSSILSEYDPSK